LEILLTNDDSADSPLLQVAIDCLAPLGNLTVVVPSEEQSWKGKSITRFDPLRMEPLSLGGVQACTFSGTPADCTNFGIYHLYGGKKPDLVVAGINIGANTGLSFTVSSGTVGACLEANIAGLPAVALSQSLNRGLFRIWVEGRQIPHDEMASLRAQTEQVVSRLFEDLEGRPPFMEEAVTWNVNMPSELREEWVLADTVLGRTFYGSCFKKHGDVYMHDMSFPEPDETEGTDTAAILAGNVSVTRLDLMTFGRGR
tara:strand:+ start:18421 stop:19188 length:768 start_codon:yes stop_codon:yes gene_type:complete